MKKVTCVFISFIILMLSLAGCSNKKNNNNEITIYTAVEDYLINEYIKSFNNKYPNIKVNIVRSSTGDITSKLLAEKDNSVADVVWGVAASSLIILDENDMLVPCEIDGLEKINTKFIDNKNKEPHWLGLSLWTNAITANLEEMKNKGVKAPNSYEDLLKTEYKKQIVMPSPASSGTGYMFISCLIQTLGEEKAWAYMDKLNENIKRYEHSGMAPVKSTETGEQFIGLGMGGESLIEEKRYPQIKTIFPKEGLAWDIDGVALVSKKEINENSKKFIEWIISEEAMKIEAQSRNRIVTLKKPFEVKGYPKNVINLLMKNDLNWASKNKEDIITKWNKRYCSDIQN